MLSTPQNSHKTRPRSFFKASASGSLSSGPGSTPHFSLYISFLFLLLHSIYIFLSFLRVSMNSDFASQVIQAADILRGNIFLKGWNLTGASFYLSELPFYVLGTAAAGADTYAYIIAASSMVICVNILGYVLSFRNHGRNPILKVLFYLALIGFPTQTWLGFLRGHCAIFICFFLILLVFKSTLSEKVPSFSWILIGMLTAFGTMSDMQILIICIFPIILFCLINFLKNDPHFDPKYSAKLTVILICGVILGMVLDASLMRLGGINKNSFLETRRFADMDALGRKSLLLVTGILNVFRIDFPAAAWTARDILSLCFVSIIILTAVIFMCSSILRYLRYGTGDPVSVVISLSLTTMCILCFFTDVYTDEDSARYISYFPFAASVLICRSLEALSTESAAKDPAKDHNRLSGQTQERSSDPVSFIRTDHNIEKPVFKPLSCVLLFLIAAILFFRMPASERKQTPQDRLAAFLNENGLTDGYADFWNASHTTVASGDQVRVRAVRGRVPELGKPDYLEMQNWFCKSEWYLSGPHNFIVFDGSGYLHVSEDVVLMLLGEPARILETDEYRIYVYDRDLTKEIFIPDGIAPQ